MPLYTPINYNELDADALDTINGLDLWKKQTLNKIQSAYDQGMAENAAANTRAGQMHGDNLRAIDNNNAARGTFKSGLRVFDQGREQAGYEDILGQLSRQAQNLATQRQQDSDAAGLDYERQAQAEVRANAARLNARLSKSNPILDQAPAAPAAPGVAPNPYKPSGPIGSPLGGLAGSASFKQIDAGVRPQKPPAPKLVAGRTRF